MARSVDQAPPPVAFVGVDVAALGLQLLSGSTTSLRGQTRVVDGRGAAARRPVRRGDHHPSSREATVPARSTALGGGSRMLPSADGLEPDTAILLQTNPGFAATLRVGMNHEMNAELLWRVYPTGHGVAFQRL